MINEHVTAEELHAEMCPIQRFIKVVRHFDARPTFEVEGLVFLQHLCTVRYGNECTTTLPREVFSQRNFVADFNYLIQLKLTFIQYFTKPPFRRLRGNVRTSSIAHWKARVYDFLFVIPVFPGVEAPDLYISTIMSDPRPVFEARPLLAHSH